MKRLLAILLTASMLLSGMVMTASAAELPKNYYIDNPYADVDWTSYGQYKADLHAHSTNSDGGNLTSAMVEDHYSKSYDILAMTDHNYLTPTWDAVVKGSMTTARLNEVQSGVGRNDRGLIQVPNTDEQSRSAHVNTFFVDYNAPSGTSMEGYIARAEELGGLSHINHPGRETGGSSSNLANGAAASNNPETVKKYVDIFNKYNSCVGMEIVNKIDNESRSDRILWDNILMQTMPEGRPVWGFSNDDSHSLNATGYSWNVMLMPSNDIITDPNDNVLRTTMETGAFYAVSRVDRREGINDYLADGTTAMPGSGNSNTLYLLDQSTPIISNIVVDQKDNAITITGDDYDVIEWIADGKKIATGETLNLNDYEDDISSYVRAQLKSTTGIAYTQPFGISELESETPVQIDLKSNKSIVRPGEYFTVDTALTEGASSNVVTLNVKFDNTKFSYAGFNAAEGATLLTYEVVGDTVKFIVMVPDYSLLNLGSVVFQVQQGVGIGSAQFNADATYVVKGDDGVKFTSQAAGLYSQRTSNMGTEESVVDMLVLSNVIDAFGMTSDNANWDDYAHFDYNGNNEIDIQDIVTVAKMVK